MGASPSIAARTAILVGVERRDANNDTVIRSTGLKSIPIYNAYNPVTPRMETTELTRAKTGLASDGIAPGAAFYDLAGEFYIFGSGIANVPPDYFEIIRACGFKEVRTASIVATASTHTATSVGSGGSLSTGGYAWRYTVMFQSDGSTPATTAANTAFESKLSANIATDATTVANDSVTIAVLPSTGIKRIYRTVADGEALTADKNFFYVGEVASGTTTFLDTVADADLGQRAPLSRTVPGAATAGASAATGSLLDATTYNYKYTVLYDKDGVAATSEDLAAFEGAASANFTDDTDAATDSIAISVLDSTGVKRVYRADAGTTNNYKWVATVASGTTTVVDGLAEASRGAALVDQGDQAVYVPVDEYLDFDALTILSYLDSRKLPAKSCRGTFDLEGQAGGNMLARFSLTGVYGTSTKVANPTLAANPGVPSKICNIGLTIKEENESTARSVRVRNLSINLNRQPGVRRDAQASCDNSGVTEVMIGNPVSPRLNVTIEVPKEIGESTDTDWVNDAVVGHNFAIKFHIGNDAREQVFFENFSPWGDYRYLAQLAEAPTYDTDGETGIRLLNLVFALTERTGVPGSFLRIRAGSSV